MGFAPSDIGWIYIVTIARPDDGLMQVLQGRDAARSEGKKGLQPDISAPPGASLTGWRGTGDRKPGGGVAAVKSIDGKPPFADGKVGILKNVVMEPAMIRAGRDSRGFGLASPTITIFAARGARFKRAA